MSTLKYKLVPVEPTPEMSAAGFCVSEAEHDPAGVYRAMIAAAPKIEQEPVAWIINHPHWCGSGPVFEKNIAEHYEADQPGSTTPLYLHAAVLAAVLAHSLSELLEMQDDECRYDHQGYCQAHNLDHVMRGCRVKMAREALDAFRQQGAE